MAEKSFVSVLDHLHRVVAPAGTCDLSDAELIERFARSRDQAAFELLVWRHGPMVYSVCRRLLRHEQDAEDALQATFLVLVRKAGSIKKTQSLASWLYKVAYRIACRAQAKASPLPNDFANIDGADTSSAEAEVIWRDLRTMLDREVAKLPEIYRRPIVLCFLEGKTHEEAARLLGCPKGTLAAQIARARDRLHRQLSGRGWTLPAAALTTVLTEKAAASPLAAELVHGTVRSALAYASGQTVCTVSAPALALAEGALRIMWYGKVKMFAALLLAVALSATGVSLIARQAWADDAAVDSQAVPKRDHDAPKFLNEAQAGDAADAKKEIAALRAEIASLRQELAAALKEIKSLKEGLRTTGGPQDRQALYQGKPVGFWLEQANDADDTFRKNAVKALGALAPRNKEVIPVLLAALKDQNDEVSREARWALAGLSSSRDEVASRVLELLDDSNPPQVRVHAAHILGEIRARSAIPSLMEMLKEKDWLVRNHAAGSLSMMGEDAKVALPRLMDVLEDAVKISRNRPLDKENETYYAAGIGDPNPGIIVVFILRIDPSLRAKLPGKVPDTTRAINLPYWERAYEIFREIYPKEK